ncbi:MAG: undecaprenyldiphospho-muramoylpentapeptide beta-N-acetylglucosaminyltransferase [Clostridia bacterium]|nr:undecaprenyldiphospho-muramoylpentapeptide beta-N-acetylglucosaminyltransferase [Clostridia bacterium]
MRILLAGGGTAGHINPAIAIAKYAISADSSNKVLFVGKKGGMESRLVPQEGFDIEYIDIVGLRRNVFFANFATAFKLVSSVIDCFKIIDNFRPDVVVGTGGYVCAPAVIAANLKKIPTLIHEQNVFPGSAIKMLSWKSTVTAISFDESKKYLTNAKNLVFTGNPVKPDIMNINYTDARARLGIGNEKYVVAFGGSLGAKKINDVIMQYIQHINNNPEIKLCFATGVNNYDGVIEELKQKGITPGDNICIRKYIDNMDVVMNAADVVIARSGAITLSELCVLGKPSILVPSPNVTNNHQEYNARALHDKNASAMILEKDFDIHTLVTNIDNILYGKGVSETMASNALALGNPDATELIYNQLIKIG